MLRYITQRTLHLIAVLFFMSIIVFSLIKLIPGDPVGYILGEQATAEQRAMLRTQLGLDRPLITQYLEWAGKAITGDFGNSLLYNKPVMDSIKERLGPTILLAFASLLISVTLGIFAGTLAAANRGTWGDVGVLLFSLLGVSIPGFWLGIMLILLFALKLPIFPSIGYESMFTNFLECMRHLTLPAITLGAASTGSIARFTRSEMIEQLSRDYITTAWAKGLSRPAVIFRHALRNSLVTVVTLVGLILGTLLSGQVIVEQVFAWPGLGQLIIAAVFGRDYSLVQAIVLLTAVIFIALNLLVDISYSFLDPQIRLGKKG
jgi:ABC-type dipeptide/oligopeptide/nickel transport system permease component